MQTAPAETGAVIASIAGAGLEPHAETPANTDISQERGTESGTLGPESDAPTPAPTGVMPADLADVVNAWPMLPPAMRAGIRAMTQATKAGER